jgi:glycosyltransferase involved in cell wall biosynthesis
LKPLISAVIPVYQGEAYLAEAIRSVLEQTHQPIECIVVDDGSTDASGEIVRGFGSRVSYVHQPKTGVSAARNRGASVAEGDYLAFLDHDDVWLPRRCERMLDALVSSTASMAVCAVTEVDAELNPGRVYRQDTQQDLLERILMFGATTVSCSSAALVPRSSFFQLGGFDESFGTSADWEFMMRNLLEGKVEYLDEPLVLYRRHGENWTRRVAAIESDMVRAFEKVFANPHLPPAVKRKERRAYARLYRNLAGLYLEYGERWAAARSVAASLRSYPPIARDLIRAVGRRFHAARRAAAGGSR